MNADFPQNEREQLEAKLTALLLGELPADEAIEIGKAMERDPELKALYERLQATIGLVRESAVQPTVEPTAQAEPLKLSSERREKLLAQFKTVTPKEFAKPGPRISPLLQLAAVLVLVGLLAALLLPSLAKSKNKALSMLGSRSQSKEKYQLGGDQLGGDVGGQMPLASDEIKNQDAPARNSTKLAQADSQQSSSFDRTWSASATDRSAMIVPTSPAPQPAVVPPPPKAEIILPSAASDPEWIGQLERQPPATTNNEFATRYAYVNLQPGQSITVDRDTHSLVVNADSVDTRQGLFGFQQSNLIAGTSGKFDAGLTRDDVSGLRYLTTNAAETLNLADSGAAPTQKTEIVLPSQQSVLMNRSTIVANGGSMPSGGFGGGGFAKADTSAIESVRGRTPSPSAPEMTKSAYGGAIQTSQLVQDGKLLYQLGKLDEADSKMQEALNQDPSNQAALYYLSLVKQGRDRQVVDARNVTSMNRMVRVEKGWVDESAGKLKDEFDPSTGQPITAPSGQSALETRTFKVDPNQFYAGLQNARVINSSDKPAAPKTQAPASVFSTNGGRGLRYVSGLDSSFEIQTATANFFRSAGANLDANKGESFFFNDRQGTITIHGTPEDLAKAQTVIDALNSPLTNDKELAAKSAPYFAAKDDLENQKRWRQILAMRTGQEEVDKNLPNAGMVEILEPATIVAVDKLSWGGKLRKALTGKVESSARIEIEQQHPDIGGLAQSVGNGYDPYFLQTEFETIKSAAVLQKVVEDLKLDGGDKSKTEAAVEQLRKNIDVSSVKNTKYIEITAANTKPEEAANIANTVALAYKNYRAEEYNELKNRGIDGLKQQLTEQDKKVQLAQAKVDELRESLGLPDYVANAASPTSLQTTERLKELNSLRVQMEADYNQQNALLEKLKAMDSDRLKQALPIAANDTQLNTLMGELDLAEQNLIKLKGDYNPDHPKYKAAKQLVDDLNRKIDDHVNGVVTGLDSEVAAMKASLDTLDSEIKVASDANIANATKTAPYFAAKDRLEQERRERAILSAKQADTALPKPIVPPATPQPEILTRENAFSTFSLNVSDVSFKLAAASLEKGQMPEPASIRSEEFINAFNYRDPDAGPGVPIAFASERARYPFAHNRELLRFSLKTAAAGRQAGRPLNIVLLLDNSGSMERADRVRIIQEALRVLTAQLHAGDTFSIVTFARTARLRVDGVPGDHAAVAAAEIARLTPEGGTNLGDALDLAYETARHHYLANGDNRVVLLTDGAANLGDVQPEVLKQKVEAHRKQGIALDCFGIGWEDYNDDLLEVLTRNGDGRYGFINKPEEASTEFVSQIAGALHVAAADVKVQVEFNPKRVTSYRQIGYAKHQLTKEQFRDNTVDAAEIAAQEAGNALYTIETNPQGEGSIATVRVRYKVPATGEYREQAWDVPYTGSAVALDQASPAMRLATTASAFSEWLATSPFAAEVTTDQLLIYLNGVPKIYGADTRPAKLEWMIRQAKSISGK